MRGDLKNWICEERKHIELQVKTDKNINKKLPVVVEQENDINICDIKLRRMQSPKEDGFRRRQTWKTNSRICKQLSVNESRSRRNTINELIFDQIL